MAGFDSAIQSAGFAEKQATPEQQQMFDKFFSMCSMILFGDNFLEKGAKMLQGAPNVVDGMAQIGSAIGTRVYSQAAKEGQVIEPIVVIEAGRKFMGEVAEFAMALGYEVSEEQAEDAYYLAADMMRKSLESAGLLDMESFTAEAEQIRGQVGEEQMQPFAERMNAVKQRSVDGMMGARK